MVLNKNYAVHRIDHVPGISYKPVFFCDIIALENEEGTEKKNEPSQG